MTATSSVAYTGNLDIDGVLSGVKWASNQLTFSFASLATVGTGDLLGIGVQTFSATQQDAVRAILASISGFASLSFTEVKETSSTQGTLRFGEAATEITSYGYYPSSSSQGGDAWFNPVDYNSPKKGNYAWLTMMHETGHTLGLDHGHEGTYALPPEHDSLEFSVMTYRSYVGGRHGQLYRRAGQLSAELHAERLRGAAIHVWRQLQDQRRGYDLQMEVRPPARCRSTAPAWVRHRPTRCS